MIQGSRSCLVAAAVLIMAMSRTRVASAQEPAPPAPPAAAATPATAPQVKLELVIGEVKMLALEEVTAWSILPEAGLSARAVDEGHTLRVVALKEGAYTLRLERKDGTFTTYAVQVGTPAIVGPPIVPIGPPVPIDPNAPKIAGTSADEKYTRDTIDLDLEGGIGRHFGDPDRPVRFARARVGVMFARWPVFTMIGATYEYNNLSPATFGVQGELLHLSGGVWGQIGAMMDTHGKAGGLVSLGFSIIGVEAQYRGYEDNAYGVAVLGKLRIPIGVILYALDVNKKKK